jgi:competence CoiA-like predicted nuclease
MNEPKHQFACPVCGLAVALWQGKECPFHHYFHENRAKHKTYEELVETFFKEYPNLKKLDA